MLNCRKQVEELSKRLVSIESVVNGPGEVKIAQYIYEHIRAIPYFQKHPEQVVMPRTVEDSLERYNVLAFVKGTKSQSNRTVVLMGHLDTVGIDDYQVLKPLACDADRIREAFSKEVHLPASVRRAINNEDWLFGRGMLDMKSGVAGHLYLLEYFSEHPEELEGNLVVLVECDEEDGSKGILSSLKTLRAWKENDGFDYIAAVNADFVAPRHEGDENRYIYAGTVGKLLPAFFVAGAETHVGSAFEGLDPNFIVAELTRQISYNPKLCDTALGETPSPPVSLKQTDLKPTYTVQTALAAYAYYNFFVHSWSPEKVLHLLKAEAEAAFGRALDLYRERYKRFCETSGEPFRDISWQPRVITYEELHQRLTEEHGDAYVSHMKSFYQSLMDDRSLDVRMFAARIVEEAWTWMTDRAPAIVVFYSSLYSPRIEVSGKNDREAALLQALEEAVQMIQPHYGHPIVTRKFFPYISDMSFVALSDNEEEIQAVIRNNPAWGAKHFVEFEDIRSLNIPVINIGPYGVDAHKKYERMEGTFSLEMVPNLTYQVVRRLMG
jgi:arginine utilization protein RocB